MIPNHPTEGGPPQALGTPHPRLDHRGVQTKAFGLLPGLSDLFGKCLQEEEEEVEVEVVAEEKEDEEEEELRDLLEFLR